MRTATAYSEPEVGLTPKRRAMIDAAEQLFLAHGYGNTSMDAVARLAGVSKATLYAHFTSKDLLFATIVGERGISQEFEDGDFPTDPGDPRACLVRIGHRCLEYVMRPRTLAIYRIAVAESARFPELGRAFHENGPARTHRRFAEWIRILRDRGLVVADDLDLAAVQFFALLRGLTFLRATLALAPQPTEAEIADNVTDAVETWLRAYGRRVEPPAG